MAKYLFILLLVIPHALFGDESFENLIDALEIACYWDERLNERFPTTFNHLLSTGYFTTHSAHMTEAGEIGIGGAHIYPYIHWNGRVQPFSFLELSMSYRIFRGVEDRGLSPYGFGDFADRGANIKVALMTPEEWSYELPGVAFGIDDFMGTKKFTTYYIVGTQILLDYGFETSFGWGAGRYTKGPSRGFFGGFNWFPLWRCPNKWIRGICFSAEYDPIDYTNPEREPHPEGQSTRTPINFGAKYNLCGLLELSASRVRGETTAFAGSLHYNWGKAEGFLPKVKDPLPYTAPRDTEPLGCYRPESVMIQNLNYALEKQGFQLIKAWLDKSCLYLSLINCFYRQEHIYRCHLQHLLAYLTPSNITNVIVIIESHGIPCQQYVYNRDLLGRYVNHCIGPYEFDILTPRQDACPPNARLIFNRDYDLWRWRLSPRFESFFGCARGKFKYDVGIKSNLEGFLPHNWYYQFQVSYTVLSTLHDVADFDCYNPSQLPNVATDYVRYRQQNNFTWDRLYLQKGWNIGRGFFAKATAGYFQVNYAGVAAEVLWYPARSCFAIGLEGAVVRKRSYAGLGFQSKLRRLKGFTPTFKSYTALEQYFLNFYFDFPQLSLFTRASVGQFLARDKGVLLELTRYFDNGVRLTGWITYTDAYDMMHGKNYYNRGVRVEFPLDLFYKCSSRRAWNYGMAAWLRDAGYATSTGQPLFEMINQERRW